MDTNVEVELDVFSGLLPEGRQTFSLVVERGVSVRQLARRAGVPLELIGLVTIDGRVAQLDSEVTANHRVGLFPHVMGG